MEERKSRLLSTSTCEVKHRKLDVNTKSSRFKTPFATRDDRRSDMVLGGSPVVLTRKSSDEPTTTPANKEILTLSCKETAAKNRSVSPFGFSTMAVHNSPDPLGTKVLTQDGDGEGSNNNCNMKRSENLSSTDDDDVSDHTASASLGNEEASSPVKDNSPTMDNRKRMSRKRKLTCTPPMLDASQSSTAECDYRSDEGGVQQVTLRSLKNFTKQVLTENPPVKPRASRYKPLDLLSGTSGAVSKQSLQPYTKLDAFRGVYSALKDKFSRMKHQQQSSFAAEISENLLSSSRCTPLPDSEGRSNEIQPSDDDEERIDVSESDESV